MCFFVLLSMCICTESKRMQCGWVEYSEDRHCVTAAIFAPTNCIKVMKKLLLISFHFSFHFACVFFFYSSFYYAVVCRVFIIRCVNFRLELFQNSPKKSKSPSVRVKCTKKREGGEYKAMAKNIHQQNMRQRTKRKSSAQYLDWVQNVLNSSFVIYR